MYGTKYEIKKYNWPGNVRELHNSIIRACLWSQKNKIDADDIIDVPDEGIDLNEILFDIEKKYIEMALSKTKSKKEAAKLLSINQKTFEKRCRTNFNL